MMKLVVPALVLLALFGPVTAQDQLVGTWRLLSATASTDKGDKRDAFGKSPTGLLTYTGDGRMSVAIAEGGRKALSSDRVSAPAEERAQAFATFLAYAGGYSRKDEKVIHHVEISSFPNWVGTDLVRTCALEGDRLTLTTPPLSAGGVLRTTELVWERLK